MTIDPEKELLSIGKLCELLSTTPAKLEQACYRTGIRPAARIDHITYYTEQSVDRIRKQLSKVKEKA